MSAPEKGDSRGTWTYIADFQSRLLLTIFYFTILVPFALIVRLFMDPLTTRTTADPSAWVPRATTHDELARARQQF